MPTANRRRFVPQAIRYFQAQDYPHKELVILDDGHDSVADLIPDDPQVRYMRLTGKRTLGKKRNECVEASRGDLIMHWDDDDWMASNRIRYQMEALLKTGANVCGLQEMLFYEVATGYTWLYRYTTPQRPWLAGGSLLYTRDFWRRFPFPNIQVASDTRFILNQRLDRMVILPDYRFYVAMIHPGNTSPKSCRGAYWSRWQGNLGEVMGDDLDFYTVGTTRFNGASPAKASITNLMEDKPMQPPTYSIIMVVHNALEMVRLSTLRTLRYSVGLDARLVVVDNASTDGTAEWLDMLAQRGDIDLIRSPKNIGHGPGIELARQQIRSPYLVTLDSDAFPVVDDWLPQLHARLAGPIKVVGIRHHRDYIHPACLMIACQTLEEFGLTFLNEKKRASRFDVAERVSHEIKRRGYQIAGLERTGAQRQGSASEPVYLGSSYEGIIYHQWYTTRAMAGTQVDDVPSEAITRSLQELLDSNHGEPRDITVIVGVRAAPQETQRRRNLQACLQALNLQALPRYNYRIVVVEQDETPYLEQWVAPLADRYIFAYNPGPYNRGWAFNIGACLRGSQSGVLCLIDADLLVPPTFLQQGLAAFAAGHLAISPFNEVVYLDTVATVRAIQDRLAAGVKKWPVGTYKGQVVSTAQGGCIWVEAALYRQIGGHDERFRGWGREDREFWERLAKATPIHRLPHRLFHLDHPRPPMNDTWAEANRRLYEQIPKAVNTPTRFIGSLNLYMAEKKPLSIPSIIPGRREWEKWHLWDLARLERIVQEEARRSPGESSRRRMADTLAQLGNSVLDVGCGPGALWLHLQPYRPRLTWAGVDVTYEMAAAAHRLFPQVAVYQADTGNLPFATRSFDVVLLRHVLEHLPPWLMAQSLAEATRVARQAVVLALHLPPVTDGDLYVVRTAQNFLETQWAVADLETPITQAGWGVQQRFQLAGKPDEKDEVWLVVPPSILATPTSLKVSIIMPTYRRPHTISRAVETIQAQTYPNWELIIVDNAGDGYYTFDDPRIRVYCHNQQTGSGYARNQGLQYITGDLVCFFDDDDEMYPTYLERYVTTYQQNPQARLVRCGLLLKEGIVIHAHATPQNMLRRPFATPTWTGGKSGQDRRYFNSIITQHGWSEEKGDIVIIPEVLCRAYSDPIGGLRSGRY